jgi:hypothetical protein
MLLILVVLTTMNLMMNNEMSPSGFEIFQSLKMRESSSKEYFSVESVPSSKYHKIGVSNEGFPLFFVSCDNSNRAIDINLELISVLFSKDCSIKEGSLITNNKYTIVLLKTINQDLQRYFTDVFSIILNKLKEVPSEKELNSEVRKVIELFSSMSKPALKTVQGLWAELLVIDKSINPEYLINSWHVTTTDKYDFNDGIDKIEVKSTSNTNRIHRFSLDQLNINSGADLLLISVLVVESGIGKSVLDLKQSISKKINTFESEIKLNELILRTLRSDYSHVNSIFFDYQLAFDSLLGYELNNIPKILKVTVPQGVLNVNFDVDFTNVVDVVANGTNLNNSLLFSALNL